jgi:DNA-binding NarL/FixJ family response regulator
MKSVLIVEDYEPFRQTIKDAFLSEIPDIQVLEAADGKTALELFNLTKPGVVLMDINIPPPSGFFALKRIKAASPDASMVVLTNHDTEEYRLAFLAHGADHFLSKRTSSIHEVVELVKSLTDGKESSSCATSR